MLKTYGAKDLMAGDVITTKCGYKYIVLVVDQNKDGTVKWGLISGDGNGQVPGMSNSFSFDENGNMVVAGRARDNGVVTVVERFDCDPIANRISEALKMLTGRAYKYHKKVIWRSGKDKRDADMKEFVDRAKAKGYTVQQLLDYIKDMD